MAQSASFTPLRIVMLLPFLWAAGAAADTAVTPRGVEGLVLRIEPDGYTVEAAEAGGESWRRVVKLGAARIGEEGRPDLPLETYLVGVPHGYTVRARVTNVEYDDLPGAAVAPAPTETRLPGGDPGLIVRADEAFYRSGGFFPGEIVSVGEPLRLRYQDAVPVRIAPFRTIPATGTLRRYTSIEVAVDFVPMPPSKRDRRSTGRGRAPTGDEGRWEGVYRGALVNYGQARSFRSRPAHAEAPRKRARTETEYKLRVRESGLYRISVADLMAKGFPSGVAHSSIAIYRRGWSDSLFEAGEDPFTEISLPVFVDDTNDDLVLDGEDWIVAYLPGFREDRMERDFQDRYADEAIYYLSMEGEARPFETRTGDLGVAGLAPPVSFPDSVRWEIDSYYNVNTPSDTVDLYFAMDERQGNASTAIDLPPPDTSVPYSIKAMTVSRDAVGGGLLFHRYVLIQAATGDTVLNMLVNGGRGQQGWSGEPLPGSHLAAGSNRYTFRGSRGISPQTTTSGAFGYLDWYEVHANFLYRAVDDYARFSNGERTGTVEMEIGGFTGDAVLLFDVTDRYAPVRISPASVEASGDGYRLVFQDVADGPRTYVAAIVEGMTRLAAVSIAPDDPTNIAGGEGDYLIISHEKFYDATAPLAEYRDHRGYTVSRVKLGDVYDEFNGGIKDPLAIRRFLRYGFERWGTPPGWAVLVGDGFEDYRGIAANTANDEDFDYVPAYPLFEPEVVGSGDRWSASDTWYGLLGGDDDPLIDVIVGRLPAKEPAEVSAMVDKITAYENFQPGDEWRNRTLFVADDEWTFTNVCMYDSDQIQFRFNTELYIRELERSAARGIDTVKVFLSRYTEGEGGIHSLCPCARYPGDGKWADVDCTIQSSRALVTPRLFDEMNNGVLMVNFQGHGNRETLTHEVVLLNGTDYRGNSRYDIRQRTVANGKPYIFMGFGCSISEFDRLQTLGDEAMTEEMMRFGNGGAVAAFGSTGIEYLGPNLDLNESILKYFYKTPGVVPGGFEGAPAWYSGVPDWSLGEILALGMNDLVLGDPDNASVIRRYVLFGDPALALDAGAPAFEVTVDGDTAQDGQSLLGNADGSPVSIEAYIHDETRIERDSISLIVKGAAVDTSLWSLELDSATTTDGRAWVLRYETVVEGIESYDLAIRAVDRNGRAGAFTLSVRIDVEVAFDGRIAVPGGLVSPEPEIVVTITTPLPVLREELGLELDGSPLPVDSAAQEGDFRWVLLARPDPRLASGAHELAVSVRGQSMTFPFRVDGEFRVIELLNYPNPFAGGTGFYYDLTDRADRVEVEIFTVSGRRVRRLRSLEGHAGYNRNPAAWDGRDQDGDEMANGVYIYRLTAWRGAEKARALGKAVVRKEPGDG